MTAPQNESMRICTASEMRAIDSEAETRFDMSAEILMENAGRAASQILLENYPTAGSETEILVFAGKGNNAGDAFVLARRLLALGRRVRVFHVEPSTRYPEAVQKNYERLKKLGARLTALESVQAVEAFLAQAPGPFTVVDGLLGTGLMRNLEGLYFDLVELINGMGAREVIALDIPTGVSGDTGAIHGTALQADLTVSFGFPKLGHFLPPGAARRGSLINVDISLPAKFRREGDKFLLLRKPLSQLIHSRDRYGHKNAFGHTLLVGGSPGRIGAIAMAARACHRMGTGLVTACTWKDALETLILKLPSETMTFPLVFEGKESETYRQNLPTYSSVVVGPGLGLRADGKHLMEELLAGYQGPMVIDADGINLIADHRLHGLLRSRKGPVVLTPHPGEMARLLGVSKDEVMKDVIASVKRAIELTHATVLLKGAATVIGSPDNVTYLNHYPNDGMATAGSGDVLAGMIGGLLSQGIDAMSATQLGVYLHSLAGDFAAQARGHRSMTATDIIENISHAFQEIKKARTQAELTIPFESRARLL